MIGVGAYGFRVLYMGACPVSKCFMELSCGSSLSWFCLGHKPKGVLGSARCLIEAVALVCSRGSDSGLWTL